MAGFTMLGMSVILCIFVHCICVLAADHVPVLIWESRLGNRIENGLPPSLAKLNTDDFSDFMTKKVSQKEGKKPVIAVFVEENLSTEDFIYPNTEDNAAFLHLENITASAARVDFLPAVHAPLKGLKRLGYHWENYLGKKEVARSPTDSGLVIFVKLGDANTDEDRPDFLSRHDNLIQDVYSDLLDVYDNLIALYTSHHSSWVEPETEPGVRRVRSLLANEDTNSTFYAHDSNDDIFVYAREAALIEDNKGERKFHDLSNPRCTINSNPSTVNLSCNIGDKNELSITFIFNLAPSQYWSISEIVLKETNPVGDSFTLKTTEDIYAPLNFSYHCSKEINYNAIQTQNQTSSKTYSISFKNLQLQPYVKDKKFGDPYDCVYFFTVPIWAGLFVTALLAFIMIWGLTMIMDIKTMDQFDDPKGKTITINVSE